MRARGNPPVSYIQVIRSYSVKVITETIAPVLFEGIKQFNIAMGKLTTYFSRQKVVQNAKAGAKALAEFDAHASESLEFREGLRELPDYVKRKIDESVYEIPLENKNESKAQRELRIKHNRMLRDVLWDTVKLYKDLARDAILVNFFYHLLYKFVLDANMIVNAPGNLWLMRRVDDVLCETSINLKNMFTLLQRKGVDLELYHTGKDTTFKDVMKAELSASVNPAFYMFAAECATSWSGIPVALGVSFDFLFTTWLAGRNLAELRLANATIGQRNKLLKTKAPYLLGLGVNVVLPTMLINALLNQVPFLRSKVLRLALQGAWMLPNYLAICDRKTEFPGETPVPQVEHLLRKVIEAAPSTVLGDDSKVPLLKPKQPQEVRQADAKESEDAVFPLPENPQGFSLKIFAAEPTPEVIHTFEQSTYVLTRAAIPHESNPETLELFYFHKNSKGKKIAIPPALFEKLGEVLEFKKFEYLSEAELEYLRRSLREYHGLSNQREYERWANILSPIARFFLGGKFAELNTMMQLECFKIFIELHKESLKYYVDWIKTVQDSILIRYSVRGVEKGVGSLDYVIPNSSSFFLPCKLEKVRRVRELVYDDFSKYLVDRLKKYLDEKCKPEKLEIRPESNAPPPPPEVGEQKQQASVVPSSAGNPPGYFVVEQQDDEDNTERDYIEVSTPGAARDPNPHNQSLVAYVGNRNQGPAQLIKELGVLKDKAADKLYVVAVRTEVEFRNRFT